MATVLIALGKTICDPDEGAISEAMQKIVYGEQFVILENLPIWLEAAKNLDNSFQLTYGIDGEHDVFETIGEVSFSKTLRILVFFSKADEQWKTEVQWEKRIEHEPLFCSKCRKPNYYLATLCQFCGARITDLVEGNIPFRSGGLKMMDGYNFGCGCLMVPVVILLVLYLL